MGKVITKKNNKANFARELQLHILLIPAVIVTFIFCYVPMGGLVIAFQDYKPYLGILGSKWVGLQHFKNMFIYPDTFQVVLNTFIIAFAKFISLLIIPVVFALLLNEVKNTFAKKSIQTLVYLPYFLSWVILAGIISDLLSVDGGLINNVITAIFGGEPIHFLGDGNWFRFTLVASQVWKDAGYTAIVFIAAIVGIDPALYEASVIDGASRIKQILNVTLPSIVPMIIVVATLNLGGVMRDGFDQVFNLVNPLVSDKGEIITTYAYKLAFSQTSASNFGFSTAVNMFNSIVGLIFILVGNKLAYKFARYTIF